MVSGDLPRMRAMSFVLVFAAASRFASSIAAWSACSVLACFFFSDDVVSDVIRGLAEFRGRADVVSGVPCLDDLCLQVLPVGGWWRRFCGFLI